MEDTTQSNRDQTAKMNASKAPQKVEVVVANPSTNSEVNILGELSIFCLLYTSPSPRDRQKSRMPSSA